MKRKSGCGTPLNPSLLHDSTELINFDYEDDNKISANANTAQNNYSSSPGAQIKKLSKVIRVWHPDTLTENIVDSDLISITSFKSVLINETTTADYCRNFVAGKLLIDNANQYRIYSIKNQEKKLIGGEDKVYKIFEEDPEIKLGFLYSTEPEGQINAIVGISMFEIAGDKEVREGAIVMHRRLLNLENHSNYLEVKFAYSSGKYYGFRALIAIRCPELLNSEEIIKKKKEKKNSPKLTITFKDENLLTIPLLIEILDYVYTDSIDFPKLTMENILKIQKISVLLKLNRLTWLCERYLYSTMGIHNVFEMVKLSNDLNVQVVKEFCFSFAKKNWLEFSGNKKGLEILGLDLFQELTVTLHTASQNEASELIYNEQSKLSPTSTFTDDLKSLFNKMEFTDAMAELNDGKTLPFHKCLFSAHHQKLAQFFLDKKDSQKNFKFPISSESFLYWQQFIYFGSCTQLSVGSACEIIEELVEKFHLEKFRDKCEEVVCRDISVDFALRCSRLTYLPWNLTRPANAEIRNKCLLFVANNFIDVNIPSIRSIEPCGLAIAHDLLDVLHTLKRSSKVKRVGKPVKQLSFK